MLVFFPNLCLIFPCFLSALEFIQGQYLPSFYNSIFAEAPGEAATVVLKFSNLSIMQVLFKTAHFGGIPHTMLLNEHKNHLAFLETWKLPKKNIPDDNTDEKELAQIQGLFSRDTNLLHLYQKKFHGWCSTQVNNHDKKNKDYFRLSTEIGTFWRSTQVNWGRNSYIL